MIKVIFELLIDTQGMEADVAEAALATVRELYLADGSVLPVAAVTVREIEEEA